MEKLNGGYINSVFRNDGEVVKYYKDCPTVYVPIDKRVQNEIGALKRFGPSLAPTFYSADLANRVITMEFINGESMNHHLENGSSTREKQELFEGLGQILSKIHAVKVPGVDIEDYIDHIGKKAMEDYAIFYKSGVGNMFDVDMEALLWKVKTLALPEVAKKARERGKLSYTHGDIWSNNIVSGRAIDWEFSIPGLPEEDLAQVIMWDIDRFPHCTSSFEKGYGEPVENKKGFMLLKLLDYMEGASIPEAEQENENGFITKHVKLLRTISNG